MNSNPKDDISSTNVRVRRTASLYFARNATKADEKLLVERESAETDPWVKSRIRSALVKINSPRKTYEATSPSDESLNLEQYAAALSEATEFLVHELAGPFADVKRQAGREIESYPSSRTHRALARMDRIFDAMRRLSEVSLPAKQEDFNLTELILDLVTTIQEEHPNFKIWATKEEPLVVKGDQSLIEIVIRNGITNAIEASNASKAIWINWGTTDRDIWINVLDEGQGLPEAANRIWEPGTTMKPATSNAGYGLTIAARAMRSMQGNVTLTPRSPRGTEFEVRWPKEAL